MSIARECDRCGAFYKPDTGSYLRLSRVDNYGYAKDELNVCGDLCTKCSTELIAWFHTNAPRDEIEDRKDV